MGVALGQAGEEQIEWALQEGALHVQGRLTDALLWGGTLMWRWPVDRGSSLPEMWIWVLLAGEWNPSQRVRDISQATILFVPLCLRHVAPSILSTFLTFFTPMPYNSSKHALNHSPATPPPPRLCPVLIFIFAVTTWYWKWVFFSLYPPPGQGSFFFF